MRKNSRSIWCLLCILCASSSRACAFPSLTSSDPKERRQAVEQSDDQSALAMIAKKDTDPGVRSAAVGRLTDQEGLEKIALEIPGSPPDSAYTAAAKIQDVAILKKLAAAKDPVVSHIATLKLSLQNPVIATRWPGAFEITVAMRYTSKGYDKAILNGRRVPAVPRLPVPGRPPEPPVTALGGDILILIYHQRALIASDNWVTTFPDESPVAFGTHRGWVSPPADNTELYKQIFTEGIPSADLATLINNSNSSEMQQAALLLLSDQTILATLASKRNPLSEAAIKRLTDQTVLARIALDKEHSQSSRVAAVERLTNQTVLTQIALSNTRELALCLMATNKLTDEAALAKVAMESGTPEAREVAMLKVWLQDSAIAKYWQGALRVAVRAVPVIHVSNGRFGDLNADYSHGYNITLEVYRDGKLFIAVESDTTSTWSQKVDARETVGRMMSQSLSATDIAELATTAPDPWVREAAAARVKDQPLLVKIATADPSPSVRSMALRNIEDQVPITRIAAEDKNEWVRASAVERVKDQEVVERIASGDKSPVVRTQAVWRLKTQTALARIAIKDEDKSVRIAAVDNLTDRTVLNEIQRNYREDYQVRGAAEKRLKNLQKFPGEN